MKRLMAIIGAGAVLTLVTGWGGQARAGNGGPPVSGCCQFSTSCADFNAPEAECTGNGGTFNLGETCNQESGLCEGVTASNLEHFLCYNAGFTPGVPFDRPFVFLQDQFESSLAKVKSPRRFCNPVNKNSEGIINNTSHLACYKVGDLPAQKRVKRNVEVTHQFGTDILTVRPQVDGLCAPAIKNVTGGPPQDIDHFKCYKTNGGRSLGESVTLQDQFFTFTATVEKAAFLCNPVSKVPLGDTGGFPPLLDPDAHLTCYRLNDVNRFINGPTAFVTDQFGFADWDIKKPRHLCLPSTKRILGPVGGRN